MKLINIFPIQDMPVIMDVISTIYVQVKGA